MTVWASQARLGQPGHWPAKLGRTGPVWLGAASPTWPARPGQLGRPSQRRSQVREFRLNRLREFCVNSSVKLLETARDFFREFLFSRKMLLNKNSRKKSRADSKKFTQEFTQEFTQARRPARRPAWPGLHGQPGRPAQPGRPSRPGWLSLAWLIQAGFPEPKNIKNSRVGCCLLQNVDKLGVVEAVMTKMLKNNIVLAFLIVLHPPPVGAATSQKACMNKKMEI